MDCIGDCGIMCVGRGIQKRDILLSIFQVGLGIKQNEFNFLFCFI